MLLESERHPPHAPRGEDRRGTRTLGKQVTREGVVSEERAGTEHSASDNQLHVAANGHTATNVVESVTPKHGTRATVCLGVRATCRREHYTVESVLGVGRNDVREQLASGGFAVVQRVACEHAISPMLTR